MKEKKELRRWLNLNLALIRLFLKKRSRRSSAPRKGEKVGNILPFTGV